MIIKKGLNLCGVPDLILPEEGVEYERCNFSYPDALKEEGKRPAGHPIQCPPRTRFVRCNLVNRSLPDGAVALNCNRHIKDSFVPLTEITIDVDGATFSGMEFADVIYGKYLPDGARWFRHEPLVIPVMKPEAIQ